MKRLIIIFLLAFICASPTVAQSALNDKADNIVGTYSGKQGDDRFRVKIVKLTDGTYRGQVIWMERDKDAKGNKILDTKNPDKKPPLQACRPGCTFLWLKVQLKETLLV